MKKITIIILLVAFNSVFIFTACSNAELHQEILPPGQKSDRDDTLTIHPDDSLPPN